MENAVEMMQMPQVQDDAAQTVSNNPTLAEVMASEPQADVSAPDSGHMQAEEPKEAGWIKTRIQKGVEKELAAVEARLRAEYEAQLAPMRDAYMQQQVDQLVSSGKITDRDMALEYLKLGGGKTTNQIQQATQSQPRDEFGRFTAQQPEAQQRARDLYTQSQAIKRATGVDVMAIYNTDPEIRNRVLNGEMDFADVYETTKQPAPPPSPVRSSNGAGTRNVSIGKMSDAEFDRLNAMMAKGAKIDVR